MVEPSAEKLSTSERPAEALAASEARLRALLEAAGEAIICIDETGAIQMVNPATERMFDYSAQELIGKNVSLLMPSPDREEHDRYIAHYLATGQKKVLGTTREVLGLKKDGTIFPVELSVAEARVGHERIFVGIHRDLTERKQAAELFRLAIEFAPNAIVMVNKEGTIVLVNAQTERFFRYRREELVGQAVEILVPERFRAAHPSYRATYLASPSARAMGAGRDLYGRRKDGSEFPVEIGLTPIPTSQGLLVLSTIVDITERKRHEKASARLAAIVEATDDAIISQALDGTILSWNPGAERVYGYSAAEAEGRPISILVPPEYRDEQAALYERVRRGERIEHFTTVRVRKDGRRIDVSLAISPLKDGAGRVIGTCVIARDVTEQKRAEEELRSSRSELEADVAALRRLQEVSTRLVHSDDPQGLLPEIVDAAIAVSAADMGNIQLTDRNSGDLKIAASRGFDRPFLDFFNSVRRGQAACGTTLETGQRVVVEDVAASPIFMGTPALDVLLAAGVRAVQSTPLVGRSGKLVGVLSTHYREPHHFKEKELHCIDLLARQATEWSERVRAEEELRQNHDGLRKLVAELQAKNEEVRLATQQLWLAAKLASVGELAASIAHELNNPLAIVTLRIESLLEQVPEGDLKRNVLQIVEQETKRMGNLVANLLQFSRHRREEISTVDIRQEATRALDLVQHHLRKRQITVVQELGADTPIIYADRQKLRQVFLNLLTNASDAMPQGGTLTLRSRPDDLAGGKAAVRIEVADTGVGIPAAHLEKVFDPFFTTKEEEQGTGLGLAICRRVVEEHHGTIRIDSEVGKGTTVIIVLPVRNGTNGDRVRGVCPAGTGEKGNAKE